MLYITEYILYPNKNLRLSVEVRSDASFLLTNFLSQPNLKLTVMSLFRKRNSHDTISYWLAIGGLCDLGQVA